MKPLILLILLFISGLTFSATAQEGATSLKPLGINLEGYDYAYPVDYFALGDDLQMAYVLLEPTANSRGETMVLLHGKNFNAAYWEQTARWLQSQGYRVVLVDQLGFGKSSKPTNYPYTFQQLIKNTENLLDAVGVEEYSLLGHGMGGMMALHWAHKAPVGLNQTIVVNPLGLEDWMAEGVPYRGFEAWYDRELKKNYQGIKDYQQESYYDGRWNDEFARWAELLARPTLSPDYPQLANVQAQTYAMVASEPIAGRWSEIPGEVVLIIGDRDRTALGKDLVSEDLKARLGRYDSLGLEVAEALPRGRLIPLSGLGHLPHIESWSRFQEALSEALSGP